LPVFQRLNRGDMAQVALRDLVVVDPAVLVEGIA